MLKDEMPVGRQSQGLKKTLQESKKPVWAGPEDPGPQGGITFSLLSRWLCCRERFRLLVCEGLRPRDAFNHKLFYGTAWHLCEQVHAAGSRAQRWEIALQEYSRSQCSQHPTQQQQVQHWYQVVKLTFPLYLEYWSRHSGARRVQHLVQEQVFRVPYRLPSGRTVYLRGKWDGVDLVGSGKDAGVWLFETKTKGEINEEQIKQQLSFDLQTMLYLTALTEQPSCDLPRTGYLRCSDGREAPVQGVCYNVVRRPLSGGKGMIVRHEATKGSKCPKCKGVPGYLHCTKCKGSGRVGGKPAETEEHYYQRVAQYIKDEPQGYFMRWDVGVTPGDIQRFRRECLDPILEQLCDWWSWVSCSVTSDAHGVFSPADGCENSIDQSVRSSVHWRHPYGVCNPLDQGGSTDLDEYLATGSTLGLVKGGPLFGELEES